MPGNKSDRASRLFAILHLIETRSGDPELSAMSVARQLGITPRYVHLLLERTGKSFSRHLLETRLQRAAALLRDPHWHERRIAAVAAAAGFGDLSHFSRAFRRRFGVTPTQLRATMPRVK
jgi:AraC-like DNA-binding protein